MTDQPTTGPAEEMLNAMWDKLTAKGRDAPHGEEIRYVTRSQLAQFMLDIALSAMGAPPLEESRNTGSVGALFQSLKVMGDAMTKEGRHGWAVIASRARNCIERLGNDVTRFLSYPGFAVTHGSTDLDLHVAALALREDGTMMVTTVVAHDSDQPGRVFPFDQLYPAGPVSDAARIMVAGMSRAIIEDTIQGLIGKGALRGLPDVKLEPVAYLRDVDGTGSFHPAAEGDPGAFPVFGNKDGTVSAGGSIDPAKVHHLETHSEYVMGPSAKAAREVTKACPECGCVRGGHTNTCSLNDKP